MPSLTEIVQWWADHDAQDLPRLWSRWLGWGEPFCFRCGWLPPVQDGTRVSWQSAAGWLERAHLHDRESGGSDEPGNLVPLCIECHASQPDCPSREAGLAYVAEHPRVDARWQLWTDSRFRRTGKVREAWWWHRARFWEALV